MNITWTGSPNYWSGRTQTVSKIVIHWMNGYLVGADKVFNSNVGTDAATSAHYGIEDDVIHQYVRTADTAWHARQANPFSIGIEHSAAPGRDATDKTYANSIELVASLCKQYNLNPDTDIVYHKLYVATSCNDLNIDQIKSGVKDKLAGVVSPVPAPANKPPLPQPVANTTTAGTVSLPASATSWRIYKPDGPYTIGNEIGILRPSLFGGITYDILSNPTANVYTVQTRDFGRVALYAGAETGALVAVSSQGITKGSGGGQTVYLPSVPSWRVYREQGPYTAGSEIGALAPARFGGLAYAVLAQPLNNVVVIQTQTFGRVAIYVGAETGATIK